MLPGFSLATFLIKLSTNAVYRICVPKGGFSHLIRWMILLSEKFTNLENLNSVGFFVPKKRYPLRTNDRVTFIQNYVYNEKRDFYNWLELEREVRISLNQIFYSVHTTDDFLNHGNETIYTLLIDTDVNLACRHFYKLHPFWSGSPWSKGSKQTFIEKILVCNQQNKDYIPLSNEKILRMSSNCLNNQELDKVFYYNLVDFLGLDSQYENACKIHSMWRNLNCKAEQNIVQFFKTNNYPALPWYKINLNETKIYDREYWNEMKNTALEYYEARS